MTIKEVLDMSVSSSEFLGGRSHPCYVADKNTSPRRHERTQCTSSNSEVCCQECVRVSFREDCLGDQRDDEQELLGEEHASCFPDVLEDRGVGIDFDLLSVQALHLVWAGEDKCELPLGQDRRSTHEGTSGRQSHEDDVHLGIDSSGFCTVGVQAEVDGAAYDLSGDAEGQPDTKESTFAEGFGIGKSHSCRQQTLRYRTHQLQYPRRAQLIARRWLHQTA